MRCCCLNIDEDFLVTLLSDRVVRALEPHQCGECGDTIGVGRLYSREVFKSDGRLATHRTCARCRNIRDEYFSCAWYYGRLVEDFRDCFGFDYTDGLPPDFAPCRGAKDDEAVSV